jgi:hypothetical protein
VRYATRAASKRTFFLRYDSYGEPDAPQSLDYYFWVIGEGAGALVVDCGFDPAVGARRGRTCLCPPREALARLGVDAASVSRLLITHFQYDHVGNLDAFPNAELLVPERELAQRPGRERSGGGQDGPAHHRLRGQDGGRDPAVSAPPQLAPAPRGTMALAGTAGRLGGNGIYKALARRFDQAGIEAVKKAQVFRHSFSHYFRPESGSDSELTTLNGWSSPAMAYRYGRSAAQAQAREAHRRLSPGNRL